MRDCRNPEEAVAEYRQRRWALPLAFLTAAIVGGLGYGFVCNVLRVDAENAAGLVLLLGITLPLLWFFAATSIEDRSYFLTNTMFVLRSRSEHYQRPLSGLLWIRRHTVPNGEGAIFKVMFCDGRQFQFTDEGAPAAFVEALSRTSGIEIRE
jgi:hypothetical protein